MSHSASKIRLHVTNFFSFILLLPTLTTACECPSDFPVCWANEVPRRCHVDSAVLSPLSNGNGCGGLNGAACTSSSVTWSDGAGQVSVDTTKLCYKVSWNLESQVPSEGVIKPITELPALHPAAGRTICGVTRAAGDRIEAYTMWPADASTLTSSPAGHNCINVTGAEVFYGYNYPYRWSANTGYFAEDTVTIYLIVDTLDRVYLVLTLDQPGTNPGGIFAMDVTSTGLPNDGSVATVLMDDGPEQQLSKDRGRLPLGLWDGTEGSFYWKWATCCTDGMVLGPMPLVEWQMTFQATTYEMRNNQKTPLPTFQLGSWEEDDSTVSFLQRPMSEVDIGTGGLRVEAYTCNSFCATFPSCGSCTAQAACGWYDDGAGGGSCQPIEDADKYAPEEWTAPGTCCGDCAAQTDREACVNTDGCGFCSSENKCMSGTRETPCDTCAGVEGTTFFFEPLRGRCKPHDFPRALCFVRTHR